MNITKKQLDDLNAVVTVAIGKEDYEDKVNKVLKDYKKQANIPGFRKGHVPFGLIKKQYGKAVLVDEVNKLLQDNLAKYLYEEKLDVLGNPLPKMNDDFDWDNESFDFEFELGLAPNFEVNLKTRKPVIHYKVIADKKMLDKHVESIQKRNGESTPIDEVTKDAELKGNFTNEAAEIDNSALFEIAALKSKKAIQSLLGKKVGDTITLNTKGLFEEDHQLAYSLGIDEEKATKLKIDVQYTIAEIHKITPAELNQELFDKLYGEGNVTSVDEMKQKIKEESETQFALQSDQKLLNDVIDKLIEDTKFDLPAEFLKKWMQVSGEEPLTEEEVTEKYEDTEKALRYQLIENKLTKEHGIQQTHEELKAFSKENLRKQMLSYGIPEPSEEMIENLSERAITDEKEYNRLSSQLLSQKLLALFKEKSNLKPKEVSFDAFVKESLKK